MISTGFYSYYRSSNLSSISFYSNSIRNEIVTDNLRSLNEKFQSTCHNMDVYKLNFDINNNTNEFLCGQLTKDTFNFIYPEILYFDINKSTKITTLYYTVRADSLLKKISLVVVFLFLFNYLFFKLMKNIYLQKEKENIENQKIKMQFNLSRKIAHDIRSPLSTLNLITNKIDHEEAKQLQISVIEQINAIAENLLSQSKINTQHTYEQIINQLKTEYTIKKENLNRSITFNYKPSEELKVISPDFLYSVLNNLIQNSIEATSETNGKISILITIQNKKIQFEIEDNGIGIPENILKQLGEKEISYGKGNIGNGLGVFTAIQEIKKYNGNITINSSLGKGTKIKFEIPIIMKRIF